MMSKNVEHIILVNPNDKEISSIEKILAHQYGMLHRAFSIFIFRSRHGKSELLLQKRSKNKYHCGGLWTNTCCSHPHPGEEIAMAANLRLKDEMGITTDLKKVGKFHYIAQLDKGMTENEIDHVFIGNYDGDDIPINVNEVEDYEWVDVTELEEDLTTNPQKYTPWLKKALELATKVYK
ncbi:Isopentenyl-diphosphate Delta-isomerase [Legionella beliardensis]|uniref:Isopentenyl-diphosphate Delta-isomerase n=1 Tax=Legionella beliardensis TaxID=91822 RepID=A0A378I4P5_9GAMM|nr:isopentenyl-diphosphate Delta-isomerase [Legionella beliardensis]STX29720.1 Isopentenyl-diphosphate Delta-isomerase [Legionella beliardensis]